MREPSPGHLVLHIAKKEWDGVREFRLVGSSIVSAACYSVLQEPPIPGVWAGRDSYYRIDLEGYEALRTPVSMPNFMEENSLDLRREYERSPRGYPFSGQALQITEGLYLRECTPALFDLFRRVIDPEIIQFVIPDPDQTIDQEYIETKRLGAERAYFARNPSLTRRAKDFYGPNCAACDENPSLKYPFIEKIMLECHHKTVLAEQGHRVDAIWVTRLEDVCLLCPNCHRAIHRKKPAFGLEEFRALLKTDTPRT